VNALISRARWAIANRLNRRPNQCWTDLVLWANSSDLRTPDSPIGWACRADAARNGHCYCNKITNTEETAHG
jgi:hypothetical protein